MSGLWVLAVFFLCCFRALGCFRIEGLRLQGLEVYIFQEELVGALPQGAWVLGLQG